MKPQNFLSFNEKTIYFKEVGNEYWIAIKPICEALNVDYIRAYKNISEDENLSQLLSKQTMLDSLGRSQEMICLPEKYIYGWIFSLRSKSEALKQYQMKCYEVLFNYFNGALIGRKKLLEKQADTQKKIERVEQELKNNPQYLQLITLKQESEQLKQQLRKVDKQALEETPSLF
ncbi:phage antirepressor N-terminal domain-containing protein [uncultured Capnocytophaga sp.]|uniref:phage antirepressor N-terminal domain-containing protein n=1 Tax=uncultured Capnocytophaga sp. TaxID=159273 RepID=UPI002595BA5C|nr:phage antirepressor N-terminal domain-containing protein [uncultured Capnocytophaga sp.]